MKLLLYQYDTYSFHNEFEIKEGNPPILIKGKNRLTKKTLKLRNIYYIYDT